MVQCYPPSIWQFDVNSMKYLIKIINVFLVLLSVLTITEITLELSPGLFETSNKDWYSSMVRRALVEKVQVRIHQGWSQDPKLSPTPFYLPWVVFTNDGFQDSARLARIAEATHFPRNGTWTAWDVFRNQDEKKYTEFLVKTNSLGFRDTERDVVKPVGTYRILVLGSYVTFGYGLNEQDSYVRKLEKKLNENKIGRKNFEVWNIGRQGSTAIMGYALLKTELLKYKPDLIILDYGWADPFVKSDHSIESSPQKKSGNDFEKKIWLSLINIYYFNHYTKIILQGSELCIRFTNYLSLEEGRKSLRNWNKLIPEMLTFLKEKGQTAIFIRLAPQMKADSYTDFIKPDDNKTFFVDVIPSLFKTQITEEEKALFWSTPNWLSEMNITKDIQRENENEIYFRTDAIHYSRIVHTEIANKLYEKVVKTMDLSVGIESR